MLLYTWHPEVALHDPGACSHQFCAIYAEATTEDLAADPAVQALIADAVRREREAVVAWLRKEAEAWASMGEDTYAADDLDLASTIESGAHHHTETDHG